MTQPLKRLLWIGILSLSLLLFANRSLAHDNFPSIHNSHLDGKVANLEINLRQLQQEVGQLQLVQQPTAQSVPQQSPIPIPQRRTSPTEPQLQNLANLVIELKQDIRDLETRVGQLEPH